MTEIDMPIMVADTTCKTGEGPVPPDAFRLYGAQLERLQWRLQ